VNIFQNKKKVLDRFTKLLQRYGIKQGFSKIKLAPLKEAIEDRLFSDSFSMIEKQSRLKKNNPDESYLSFML
jgi:hypothetical protein